MSQNHPPVTVRFWKPEDLQREASAVIRPEPQLITQIPGSIHVGSERNITLHSELQSTWLDIPEREETPQPGARSCVYVWHWVEVNRGGIRQTRSIGPQRCGGTG